jgi:AcrR family transcriptional regulator
MGRAAMSHEHVRVRKIESAGAKRHEILLGSGAPAVSDRQDIRLRREDDLFRISDTMSDPLPLTRSAPRIQKSKADVLRDFRTDQILDAATVVFGKLGYASASIERIAEEAGVARSTVYVYFPNKELLLNHCLARHRVALSARVREALEGASGFEARLAAFFTTVLGYVGEVSEFFRALMGVRGVDPFFGASSGEVPTPELETLREEVGGLVDRLFADAIAAGELAPESEALAREALPLLLYGALMRRTIAPGSADASREAAQLVRVLVHGVRAPR